ncbi:MAG: aminopeptidase N [Methylohalobius crimeensis]
MREGTPEPIRLADYQPPAYWVDRIDLTFDLDPETTRVEAKLDVRRNPASESSETLILNGEDLELEGIVLDGQTLAPEHYRIEDDQLIISSVPDRFTLETRVRIHPDQNTRLEGLYVSKEMLCTQCEAEGFRRITYFPDRPDVMARFRVTLRADKERYPVLLAGGNRVAQQDLPGGRHAAVWEDPFPKPSYLFALVAGRLAKQTDTFTTHSGREVLLELYVASHDLDKCDHALDSLKRAMRWDEVRYGREYDLDRYMIVAVGHFNMGAMENKGLNLFNTQYVLAKPETATDADYENILAVIGHEYFHNWTGNRITLRDWFQLSLKEGLTVLREQQFSADEGSPAVRRIEDVNLLRTRQFPEDEGPLAHPVRPDTYLEINNFYTMTVYEKGAEVVRMLHTLLGEQDFRRGMDRYFERYDGRAITCEDFVDTMAEASGMDLSQFMRWYTQAGTPRVEIGTVYDPDRRTFTLTCRQTCPPTPGQPRKEPLFIPIEVGLLDPNGQELPLQLQGEAEADGTSRILKFTQSEQSFTFVNLPHAPVLSALRGYSAPVKLSIDRPLDEWHFLWQHDSDAFSRWDAGQILASTLLLEQLDEDAPKLDARLIEGFRTILEVPGEDLSLSAQLMSLPDEDYLAEQMPVIDVDGIHQVREHARRTLAERLKDDFLAAYRDHHRPEEARDVSAGAIGRRRLKNVCLEYLACLEEDVSHDLTLNQFRQADNMTDQLTALRVIAHTSHPQQAECLEAFRYQWRDEPLVIDKWFTVQATSPLPGALARIESLLARPEFDLANPNRVRSALGAFTRRNPTHFHARDGGGYRVLAESLLELDRINPQVATRLAQPLSAWRRYDEARQARMRGQLERLYKTPGLSKDLFEIVDKALAS